MPKPLMPLRFATHAAITPFLRALRRHAATPLRRCRLRALLLITPFDAILHAAAADGCTPQYAMRHASR